MVDASPPPQPDVSLVISTFQRRDSVLRLIDTLATQTTMPREVIVVVDGSTDGTTSALAAVDTPFPLRVVTQHNQGLSEARNHGTKTASGEWVLFLDDDMALEPSFLESMARNFVPENDVVIGQIKLGDWLDDSILTREARAWEREARETMLRQVFGVYSLTFQATAVRRALVDEVGGFDVDFATAGEWGNEDIEFAYRLALAGARIRYEDDAIVRTDYVTDPDDWLRRYSQLGPADVRLVTKHPALAPAIYGRYAEHSRIHRLVAPAVLRFPVVQRLATPVRKLVVALLQRGHTSWWVDRGWFTVRAITYWAAVAAAGGHPTALAALKDASPRS